MTPVFFYHLERQPLDAVLPRLLVTSLERGWRVVVQAASDERAEALAAQLWGFDDESFIPHGTKADGFPDLQPVWLTSEDENPNNANVRFYVDGTSVGEIGGLTRAVIMFDGNDEQAVEAARAGWKRFKAAGHEVSYWQQDEQGRWQNRAAAK
ncbi:DNA polymerase III subunit chi [Aestuariivirga litoralis]|uniref:DNA polymerase III subunit chi n=1 Tax=Aestuariivirga litoralis TaxID=2650924 RepID=A0A2W2BXL4_9HYPH|nr:DNA polymerase III subunit chi [Aestuariivirga litoralis]PZF78196.1 DNA polymerase III subunit chi [Aestuariivirga litoralis]